MEALIVISIISIVVFFAVRANRKDKKDREVPVKPPVIVKPPVVVEPTPEPEPVDNIINIDGLTETVGEQILEDYNNTRILRDTFKEANTVYQFPEGDFYTYGILPEDPINKYNHHGEIIEIKQGAHGIVRVEDKDHVTILGNENGTTLFNIAPAVWDGDDDGDGMTDRGYPTTGSTMSQRKFIRLINSNYPFIYNIGVRSSNDTPVHKPNRPEYDPHYEFEHGIHAQGSKFVHIENFIADYIYGDGIYLNDCWDVYVKNAVINWNGRQGSSMISGGRAYFEQINIANSPRSGFDIEGNSIEDNSKDFVITYSRFNNQLLGLPMGGGGSVKNVLSINNIYETRGIYSRGDGKTRIRENIMYVRHNARNFGDYEVTENILIDGIEQVDLKHNSLILGSFMDCIGSVTIRNNDLPNYGWGGSGDEPFFIVTAKGMSVSQFKIYNNKQEIGVLFTDEAEVELKDLQRDKWYSISTNENVNPILSWKFEEWFRYGIVKNPNLDFVLEEGQVLKFRKIYFPKYTPTEQEDKSIPFETSEWMEMQWDRLYTNGYGWREENYVDDGWRPDFVKANYKKIGK